MDDEDEMAALRANSRYGGNLKAKESMPQGEDDMRSFFPASFGQEKTHAPKAQRTDFASFTVPRREKPASMAVIGKRGARKLARVPSLSDDEAPFPDHSTPSTSSRYLSDEAMPAPTPSLPSDAVPRTHDAVPRTHDAVPPGSHDAVPPDSEDAVPPGSEDAVPSDSDSEDGHLHPVTHEVVIPAYEKTVTAIAIDKHGSNMVTGSILGVLRYWDFNGMNRGMKPYREFIPKENHSIQALDFNERGNLVLCVTSDVHCRIFDREGSQTATETTVVGDMYIRDMAVTKGHTKMLTDGIWHPKNPEVWISSSMDGTVRIWNVEGKHVGMDNHLTQEHVLKTVDKRGVPMGATGRSATGNEGVYPMTCRYAPDGRIIVAGCSDGSIQIFFEKLRYVKPDKILRDAHSGGVCNVHLFAERMLSRSLDGTMKLWNLTTPLDIKKPPLHVWADLPTESVYTSCASCPDNEYAITGTCEKKGNDVVRLFSMRTGQEECVVPVTAGATRIHWSGQINQIIVGNVKGGIAIKYNPKSSRAGALDFLSKEGRRNVKAVIDNELGVIPVAVAADDRDAMRELGIKLRRDGSLKEITRAQRNRERIRRDQKTIVPPKPDTNHQDSMGDNITQKSLHTQTYMATFGKNQLTTEDAQKALLSYNSQGIDDYLFRAYNDTQPEKLLDYSERDETDGDRLLKGRHCPKCGRKLCSCGYMKKEAEERGVAEGHLQRQKDNEARQDAMKAAKRQKTE